MRQLIVNADDYGRTAGVSKGIRTAHLRGIVTSTTAMMNMPGIEVELEKVMKSCPSLGLGVHLVLTSGKPLLPDSKVRSLVDELGNFPSADAFLGKMAGVNIDQVHLEWTAQVEKFIKLTGRHPDHLDSHHHTSYFSPDLFRNMLELARDLECAIRPPLSEMGSGLPMDLPPELAIQPVDFIPSLLSEYNPRCPNNFYSSFYDQNATLENVITIITSLTPGTSELMCHPGLADEELIKGSIYNIQREAELKIITDPILLQILQDHQVQLIHFQDL